MTKQAKVLRDQSVPELNALLVDLRGQLFELLNELALSSQPEQPHRKMELRREIARVLTILKEKTKEEAAL